MRAPARRDLGRGRHGAQVTVADYRPKNWPPDTVLLIRRVRLDPAQVSGDPPPGAAATLHHRLVRLRAFPALS